MAYRLAIVFAGLLITLSAPSPVHAALLNDQTVNAKYFFPDLASEYADGGNQVVGAGVEYSVFADMFDLDLGDTTIVLSNASYAFNLDPTDFNGFVISDVLNTIRPFASVTINNATNLAGFDASRISFSGDEIYVNLGGLSWNESTVVALDLDAVPEPTTIVLVSSALAVLAVRARKRPARQ